MIVRVADEASCLDFVRAKFARHKLAGEVKTPPGGIWLGRFDDSGLVIAACCLVVARRIPLEDFVEVQCDGLKAQAMLHAGGYCSIKPLGDFVAQTAAELGAQGLFATLRTSHIPGWRQWWQVEPIGSAFVHPTHGVELQACRIT